MVVRMLIFLVAIGIPVMVFRRLRARSLAIRGLYSLGFLGLVAVVVSAGQPARLNGLLIGAAIPFGILAILEVWEAKKTAKPQSEQGQASADERRD